MTVATRRSPRTAAAPAKDTPVDTKAKATRTRKAPAPAPADTIDTPPTAAAAATDAPPKRTTRATAATAKAKTPVKTNAKPTKTKATPKIKVTASAAAPTKSKAPAKGKKTTTASTSKSKNANAKPVATPTRKAAGKQKAVLASPVKPLGKAPKLAFKTSIVVDDAPAYGDSATAVVETMVIEPEPELELIQQVTVNDFVAGDLAFDATGQDVGSNVSECGSTGGDGPAVVEDAPEHPGESMEVDGNDDAEEEQGEDENDEVDQMMKKVSKKNNRDSFIEEDDEEEDGDADFQDHGSSNESDSSISLMTNPMSSKSNLEIEMQELTSSLHLESDQSENGEKEDNEYESDPEEDGEEDGEDEEGEEEGSDLEDEGGEEEQEDASDQEDAEDAPDDRMDIDQDENNLFMSSNDYPAPEVIPPESKRSISKKAEPINPETPEPAPEILSKKTRATRATARKDSSTPAQSVRTTRATAKTLSEGNEKKPRRGGILGMFH